MTGRLLLPPRVDPRWSIEQLGAALQQALETGALETAEQIVRERLGQNEALASEPLAPPAIEALLVLGDHERASAVAARHRTGLALRARGQALLELVGLGSDDWLPNGRPHALRLSRRVAAGALDAEGLARLLLRRPLVLAHAPDLHLLCFSALWKSDAARAVSWLNRYLRVFGAARCEVSGSSSSSDVLSQLRFAPVRAGGPESERVSVLVAARNAVATIEPAVRSLLSQTYPNTEILVGDDASDDATWQLLERCFAQEARVRLFRSARQQGAYNLRNALAARARGRYLTFHDADDLALPHRIARQLRQLERPGVVACVGNFVRLRPDGSVLFFKDQRATRLCPVSLMLERKTFIALGGFRPARVGADLELFTALRARYGEAALMRLREPLLLGLAAPHSATRNAGTEALENGYRSPSRRAYSQAVGERYAPGGSLTDRQLDARLRETDNYVEPAETMEVDEIKHGKRL